MFLLQKYSDVFEDNMFQYFTRCAGKCDWPVVGRFIDVAGFMYRNYLRFFPVIW